MWALAPFGFGDPRGEPSEREAQRDGGEEVTCGGEVLTWVYA